MISFTRSSATFQIVYMIRKDITLDYVLTRQH
jgi:hypothetical protein